MMREQVKNIVVVVFAVALLAGAATDEVLVMTKPEDAEAYQKNIRDASTALGMRFGNWIGEDMPVPVVAISMLRPNVIISRRYINFMTGQSAQFLLVQCADARDLGGHWPPNCYPAQGWKKLGAEEKQWDADGLAIEGFEYRFAPPVISMDTEVVDNFMVLPDGRIAKDITAVRAAAVNVKRRFYGAAQVQVITSTTMPDAARTEIFEAMVAGHRPVIEAIRAGVK